MTFVMGVLIVSFGIWGIGDIFRGNQAAKPVAQVGGIKYTQEEFRRDLKQEMDRFAQAQHFQLTAQQFAQLGGVTQVVGQAVNRLTLKVFTTDHDLGVSQQTAIAEIQADPRFKNELGQFDRDRFIGVLQQANLSEAGYVDEIRSDLVNRALYRSIFGGIAVPKPLVTEIYLHVNEQRSADVLVIPTTAMTDIPAPDDAVLQKYQKDHAEAYKAPEYRAATVLQISPEDLVGEISVTDQEIQQEYEAEKAQFSTPDIREIEQAVVQDQAAADKIEAAVKGGAAFADAVKQVTGGAPVGLGKITSDKLPKEIAGKVFALSAGAVSDPLTSPFGIHVVHIISSQPGTTKMLDEVKDQLKHTVALSKAGDALDSIVKDLDDTLAGGATIDQAADKLKLKTKKLDAVDASGKDAKGGDTGLSPDVVKLVFGTDSGNLSAVTPMADGSYAVVQVTSITPPAERPFDQVKDQVKADWLADQQRDAAVAKAKAIADKVKSGGDLAAEALALGQTIKTAANFSRDKGDPANGVEPGFAAVLFGLKQGEAGVGDSKDGPVVGKVTAITPPDPATHPDDVDTLRKQLESQIRSDLAAEFGEALRQEVKPQVNQDVVNQQLQE